ncbi:alpha/beta hydrolase [Microbacterium sp. M1A1_1b]
MGKIEFNAAAADAVIRAATSAEDELRAQSAPRRSAVEEAAADFSGTYADRFTESASAESTDRGKLASVLNDLASQVRDAKSSAEAEEERLNALDAWNEAERDRQHAAATSLLATATLPPVAIRAPKPSEIPIRPPSIHAAFAPRERSRSGGGTGNGRSSADPARLRDFSTVSRANDAAAGAKASTLTNSWTAFTASSSWVVIDGCTFVTGFERFLEENRADAAWIDRIADAFDQAGGDGSLTNAMIDRATDDELVRGVQRLFADGLTPAEVAAMWTELGLTREDTADLALLPTSLLTALGNLEGTPYWARGAANVAVLDRRIASAKQFLDDLDRPDRVYSAEARKNAEDLSALESIKSSLSAGGPSAPRTLVVLSADHPPLAAVSIGDLDEATNVTWAVPGMGSSTGSMTDWTDAAQNVYSEQAKAVPAGRGTTNAVVAWMGYEAPPVPPASNAVFGSDYAKAGGEKLAASIKGLDATRASSMPTVNVLGHSYGTTTASYALTTEGVHVDSFTSIASAGIPDSIHGADEIHADAVYAGQAEVVKPIIEHGSGDEWAAVGRDFSSDHHQDPTAPEFGATSFGADGAPGLKPVRDHGVHTWYGGGYLDEDTQSLQNVAYATTGQPERLTK